MQRFQVREFLSNSQAPIQTLPGDWLTRGRFHQFARVTGAFFVWAVGNPLHGFPLALVVHWVLIALAGYLACWLRFDGDVPPNIIAIYLRTMPWLIVIRSLIFVPFGLYDGLWKYTGIWDLSRIVLAVR